MGRDEIFVQLANLWRGGRKEDSEVCLLFFIFFFFTILGQKNEDDLGKLDFEASRFLT